MSDLIKIDKYCELGKTSLRFKRDVSQDEWMQVFKGLKMIEGCVQFWIGDCLSYRQQKWGMYDDIAEETGYDKSTLATLKSVSQSVKPLLRNKGLSFDHHKQVAALPPEKQERFLSLAVEEELSVRELREEIKKEKRAELKAPEIPKGKYQIIYADPPWKYDFSETDSRKIENKYPTMTIDELCSMGIPGTTNDALLLMWATAPKLKEAMQVIESWDFNYITHCVWDKEKIGMGYWFRGQHEILMVATRGKFSPPKIQFRKSSVYRESRSDHSKKPIYFYEWVEAAYPREKKIELFARSKRDGWEAWGNECV